MIYCTSCKHHVRHRPEGVIWCKSPNNGIDLADGSAKTSFANSNRNDENRCGQDAKWWGAKEEIKLPWWEILWSKIP